MNEPEYYTADEVAAIFRVSPRTIYAWVSAGKIKAWKIERIIRIHKDEVARLKELPCVRNTRLDADLPSV